jgi:hypothetical protein
MRLHPVQNGNAMTAGCSMSGLGTCVTQRFQDLDDTPPSAVELITTEQRYRAVLEVQAGCH